jgi:hypothetical protein
LIQSEVPTQGRESLPCFFCTALMHAAQDGRGEGVRALLLGDGLRPD